MSHTCEGEPSDEGRLPDGEEKCKAFPRHPPLPSMDAIVNEFWSSYGRETEKLKKCFQGLRGSVSITMSHWATNVTIPAYLWCNDVTAQDYVCLTAQYVDNDWKLRKRIINFRLVPLRGRRICKSLVAFLAEWKVKKLFSISMEKTLANYVTPLQLKNSLHAFLKPGSELHYMPCHADVLKVLAREVLNSIDSSLERIRGAIMYVEFSVVETKLYEIAKELEVSIKKKLYMDDSELWHSTYFMLENASRFQEAFVCLESVDSSFKQKPTQDDWIKVRSVCKFLKLYYKAAKLFSDRSTTADMYFFEAWKICMYLKKESKNTDPFTSSLAKRMQDMFNEFWNSCFTILAIATVFNPRHKMLLVEFCLQKLYDGPGSADPYIKAVRDGLQKLYDEYDSPHLDSLVTDGASSSSSSNGDHDEFDDDFLEDYEGFLEKYYPTVSQKSELELYLEEKVFHLGNSKFDILTYWRLNESRFLKLTRLARDVLAVPIVALASDSVFLLDNRIIEEHYCSQGPVYLEMKICMQNWFQESHPPSATILDNGFIFDEKDFIEEEKLEEEEEENEEQYEDERADGGEGETGDEDQYQDEY